MCFTLKFPTLALISYLTVCLFKTKIKNFGHFTTSFLLHYHKKRQTCRLQLIVETVTLQLLELCKRFTCKLDKV